MPPFRLGKEYSCLIPKGRCIEMWFGEQRENCDTVAIGPLEQPWQALELGRPFRNVSNGNWFWAFVLSKGPVWDAAYPRNRHRLG